jgi:hypothetical protein
VVCVSLNLLTETYAKLLQTAVHLGHGSSHHHQHKGFFIEMLVRRDTYSPLKHNPWEISLRLPRLAYERSAHDVKWLAAECYLRETSSLGTAVPPSIIAVCGHLTCATLMYSNHLHNPSSPHYAPRDRTATILL